MTVRILYFAWLRERIGKAEEELELPSGVTTVGELMRWLAARDAEHAAAFANPRLLRAALDRTHVQPDAAIAGGRELAFFPPMTGG